MSDVFFGDEGWVLDIMQNLKFTNSLGYGAPFWVSGNFILHLLGDTAYKFALRFIALCFVTGSGYFIYLSLKNRLALSTIKDIDIQLIFIFIIMLAFYSTPFLWYTGKFITVEFYLIPFLVFLIYKFIQKADDKILPTLFIFLGMMSFMKASSLPVAFSIFAFLFFYKTKYPIFSTKNIMIILRYFLYFMLGALIVSLNVLWETEIFFKNLLSSNTSNLDTFSEIVAKFLYIPFQKHYLMLFEHGFFGDLARNKNVNALVFPVFSFFSIGFLSIRNMNYHRQYCFAYTVSILFFVFLLNFFSVFVFHWFALCLFPLFFYLYSVKYIDDKVKLKLNLTLLSLIIVINIASFAPSHLIDIKTRKMFHESIINRNEVSQCIVEKTAHLDYQYILWLGMNIKNHKKETIINHKIFEENSTKVHDVYNDPPFVDFLSMNKTYPENKILIAHKRGFYFNDNLNYEDFASDKIFTCQHIVAVYLPK